MSISVIADVVCDNCNETALVEQVGEYGVHCPRCLTDYMVLSAQLEKAREAVRWIAQTVHQGHHKETFPRFENCPKATCKHAADVLAKAGP